MRSVVCYWLVGAALFTLLPLSLGFRLNTSNSLPYTLYRLSAVNTATLKHGQVIAICPPRNTIHELGLARGYIARSRSCDSGLIPLLKTVAALPGDQVSFNAADQLLVNQQVIAQRLLVDSQNRLMPPRPKSGLVPEGSLWAVATYNPRSWDSRYFGALPITHIQGMATPIF